jgi:hypothetical protein
MKVKDYIRKVKKKNLLIYYVWTVYLRFRGILDLKFYSDKEAIKKLFYFHSNRYPDLDNPRLFSDKMQWMKLNYHADKMDMAADKDAVREWIIEKGYGHILNEKYAVYKSVAEIDPKSLASQFVLKATHGSGWTLIVKD